MGSQETLCFHIDSLNSRYSSSSAIDYRTHSSCKQNWELPVYSPDIQGLLGPNTLERGQMPGISGTEKSLTQGL